jgi:hypothetical protein
MCRALAVCAAVVVMYVACVGAAQAAEMKGGYKVEFASKPVWITTDLRDDYTVKLTSDSKAEGKFVWSGMVGEVSKDGKSFSFDTFADNKSGEYLITVVDSAAQDRKATLKILIKSWPMQQTARATVEIAPDIKPKFIADKLWKHIRKSMKDSYNFVVDLEELTEDEKNRKKLEAAWNKNGSEEYSAWLAKEVEKEYKRITEYINEEAEHKRNEVPKLVDAYAKYTAGLINRVFKEKVPLEADYSYSSAMFKWGDPGWGEIKVDMPDYKIERKPKEHTFELTVPVKPAGVFLEDIQVKITMEVFAAASLSHSPFFHAPGKKILFDKPKGECRFRPILQLETKGRFMVNALSTVKAAAGRGWGSGEGEGIQFGPKDGYPFFLEVKLDNEPRVRPLSDAAVVGTDKRK